MKTLSIVSLPLLLALGAGCTGSMQASTYAHATGDDAAGDKSALAAYAPGKKVFVDAGASCAARLVASEPASFSAPSARGEDAAQPSTLSLWKVDDARVHGSDEDGGFLALKISRPKDGARWIALRGGHAAECVHPASDSVAAAFAGQGTTFVFTPWKPTCDAIEAQGDGVDAMLVRSEGGVALVHEGVVLGPRDARGGRGEGRTPWIQSANGAVRIRADVFRACFTEQSAANADAPASPSVLLHVDARRCTRSNEGAAPHVACTTTLGVWHGVADDKSVSLRLARRTLGRVDFLGKKLVSGSRWASTVVSVSTRRGSDASYARIYDIIDERAAAVVSRDANVRVAPPTDGSVTHRVTVDPKNIVVGAVVARDEQGTSKYKIGEKPVPNPAKRQAREAIAQAEQNVRQAEQSVESAVEGVRAAERHVIDAKAEIPKAEQEYQEAKRNQQAAIEAARQAKETCLNGCNGFSGQVEKSNCRSACEIAGTGGGIALQLGMEPNRDGIERAKQGVAEAEQKVTESRDGVERAKQNVVAAKQRVEDARRRERELPETVQEDVLAPWNYPKKVYTRALSASVVFSVRHPDGREETKTLPVATEWSDFDVQADPAHNVAAHAVDRAALDRADPVVPILAAAIGRTVGDEMHRVLGAAEREQMKLALAAAHVETEPDYELVDAAAYGMAGARIARVARRGAVELGGAPFHLPIGGVALGADECLLAVASADGAADGRLEMLAMGGRFGDVRHSSRPAVEICANELPQGRAVDDVVLRSARPDKVHYSLFVTRAGATK